MSGIVRDGAGEPIAGAAVAILPDEYTDGRVDRLTEAGALVTSKLDGSFALASHGGSWPAVLSVRHNEYQPRWLRISAPATDLEIVLSKGDLISGVMLVADSELPAPGVRVVARGVAATFKASHPEVVPAPRARIQTTVTDARGGFALRGLEEGWYLVEAVAPGLTMLSPGSREQSNRWHLFGERGYYVRAGTRDVKLRLLPVVQAGIRVVDDDTRLPVLLPIVQWRSPPGMGRVGRMHSTATYSVLVNGRDLHLEEAALPASAFAALFVSRQYPVPQETRASVRITVEGYEPQTVELPVVPAGESSAEDWIQTVRMRRVGNWRGGAIRFRFVGAGGRPIAGQAVPVGFEREGGPPPRIAHLVAFGTHGESEPIVLPAGRYTIRAAGPPQARLFEPVTLTVAPGTEIEQMLSLSKLGGVELSVRDESGKLLDGAEVALSTGDPNLVAGTTREERGVRLSGRQIMQPAGLGFVDRVSYLGFRAGLPLVIDVARHGYAPARLCVTCKAGVVQPVTAVLKETPAADWRAR